MSWNITGHELTVRVLQEHVAHNRIRHAYLFIGPRGVGRRTLALRLAQAINCPQPPTPGEPCGVCSTCRRLENMQHPDLVIVQAEQEGSILKVDQIRELQHGLSLAPYEAHFKVALLLRFEEANPSASNALLKTLEEPSQQVVLMLTAESTESLLPTIVSRCEVIRLAPLPLEQVKQGLQSRWDLGPEQANLLAHLSSGRLGHAVRLHQQPEQLEKRQSSIEDLLGLLVSNRLNRFSYAETLTKDKDTTRQTLLVWLSYWRDVMLRSAGSSTPLTNLDRQQEIEQTAEKVNLSAARKMVTGIEQTLALLERPVNARLAVEVLLLDMPRL